MDWIERWFGISPDNGNGSLEALVLIALVALPVGLRILRASRVGSVGGGRFFRALRLWCPVSCLFTLLVVGGIVWTTWDIRLSVADVIAWLADWLLTSTEGVLPSLAVGWTNYSARVGGAILVAIGAGVIASVVWPRTIHFLKDRYPRAIRRLASAAKWVRSGALNLLWLLGGAPLWIAFGAAAFAWISYLFFHLPFLRATRHRP